MNDDPRSDIFGPFAASIRNHLGIFADEWMKGKIALQRKLNARIELETDPDRINTLCIELHEGLLSADDVELFSRHFAGLVKSFGNAYEAITEVKKTLSQK